MKTTFVEKQRFNQWGIWALLAAIYLSPFIVNINNIIERGFWGTFSKGILAHIITLGVLIILFFLIKLKTGINSSGISVYFFPFSKKHFHWEDIKATEIIDYNRWRTRGNGFRLRTPYGTLYSIRGTQGLAITLKSGKAYLIGTQKPKEMQKTIQTHNANTSQSYR